MTHSHVLDGIIALNSETVEIHRDKLNDGGFILCGEDVESDDSRTIKIPMAEMAKELGNPRVSGTIAVGAIMKLFGENLGGAEQVLKRELPEKYFEINLEAIKKGFDNVDKRFEAAAGDCSDCMLISGSQAVGLGAIAAGLKFYCAYPHVAVHGNYGLSRFKGRGGGRSRRAGRRRDSSHKYGTRRVIRRGAGHDRHIRRRLFAYGGSPRPFGYSGDSRCDSGRPAPGGRQPAFPPAPSRAI